MQSAAGVFVGEHDFAAFAQRHRIVRGSVARMSSRALPWAAAVAVAVATTLLPAAALAQEPAPVRTVPFVDLERYAGDWFEIARFPNRFQRQCLGDVRASYARRADGRIDVVTAKSGQMFFEGERNRYLRLDDGFRVEGPDGPGLDYRLIRYKANEVALPDRADTLDKDDPSLQPTSNLLGDARPAANAQLHARLTPPLLALAFALLTLPLSRSSPRQTRYGRVMLGFLAYLVGISLMFNGTQWLSEDKLPGLAGLWWLTLPLLAAAIWFYLRDGRPSRPRRRA